jgi:hypothetical protein
MYFSGDHFALLDAPANPPESTIKQNDFPLHAIDAGLP